MQSPLTTLDRTKLRMERQRRLELEQLQWEQEALVMPEALNRALFLSFESVKTEFSDLDGLSWSRYPVPLVTNPWAIEEPTPKLTCAEIDASDTPIHLSPLRRPPQTPIPYPSAARAEMASFAPQDTIRVSRLAQSRSPLQPANQVFPSPYTSHRDSLAGSPYGLSHSHSTANIALACRCLRQPTYDHS